MRNWQPAAIMAVVLATPAAAQSLKPDEVYSSVAVTTVAQPRAVPGADGRIHIAYEYAFTNTGTAFVTINRIEALAPGGRVDGQIAGAALGAMMRSGEATGTGGRLPVGGAGYVLMDVSYPAGTALPATLAPRITITRELVGADGKPAAFPPTEPVPATVTFTGPATAVGQTPAVIIAPPLRGAGWVAVNGCCDAMTSHRGAIMAINGVALVPERFAIDWIRIDAAGRAFTGPMTDVKGYPGFGSPVHAVADGTVVNIYDQAAEQVPGIPKGVTTESIGGNMIVLDIGGGNFAFFAHLQPGSLKVKLGDRVKTGQVIALLGNSGNTNAPHLHFHVMDGPSPLNANSLPYAFTRFTGTGRIIDSTIDAAIDTGAPFGVDDAALSGPHVNQLPLNNQIVDFGG
jgi:hypothetical protein